MSTQENFRPPSVVDFAKNGFAVPTTELAAAFDEESEGVPREAPTGVPFVRIDHDLAQFRMPDDTLADTIEGYPIYQFQRRSYWAKGYKVGESQPPTCWSNDMVKPVDACEQQSLLCVQCKWNEWESAPVGSGKACKTQLFVFLLNPASSSPVSCLVIPPSSLRSFIGSNAMSASTGAVFQRAERLAGRHEVCWIRIALEKVEGAKHSVTKPEIVCTAPSVDEARAIAAMRKGQIVAMESFRSSVALLEDHTGEGD